MEIFDMEKVIDENKQGQSLVLDQKEGNTKKLFIESYGCQMNFSDSEIVASILYENGYNTTQNLEDADLVLVNTCSIRDKAEQTIRKRLEKYNAVKKINPTMKVGVLGCMAERLKSQFLDQISKRPCQPDMSLGFILSLRIYSDGHCTKPDVNCCEMVSIQKTLPIARL